MLCEYFGEVKKNSLRIIYQVHLPGCLILQYNSIESICLPSKVVITMDSALELHDVYNLENSRCVPGVVTRNQNETGKMEANQRKL